MFKKGDRVEKFAGDYGGPGVVVGTGSDENGKAFIAVSFRIEGGFGHFVHFLREHQLRSWSPDIDAETVTPKDQISESP